MSLLEKYIKRNTKGITLISLVISIIILLILAGISISMLTGQNILNKAAEAKEKTEKGAWNEQKQLIILEAQTYENKDMTSYLSKKFQQIDETAIVADVGNGYYIECNNEKLLYDYDFNEYEVNEGDTNFWIYTENDDKTLTIIGYKYKPSGEIIIPNFIDGKKVKTVKCSFKDNTDLISMTISYGVEEIIGELFTNCTNITGEIGLPTSLTYLEGSVFQNCTGLTGNLTLDNVTYIGNHVFQSCTGLNGTLSMSEKGATIGYMSFYVCPNLKGKAIISGFTSGSDLAFTGCKSMEAIELKNGITTIPQRTFSGCSSIETVNIPESIKEIGAEAFRYCSSLKKLTMPHTIENVGTRAFEWDKALDCTIELSSKTIIGELAFSGCKNLKINYID